MKMTSSQSFSTLPQFVLSLPQRKNSKCLNVLDRYGELKSFSCIDYYRQIEKVTKALIESGIQKGDKIAIFSTTRHEWSVCDLAITCAGAIVVPLYPNMTTEDLLYTLNHSGCKLIFAENRTSLKQLMVIRDRCAILQTIILFTPPPQPEPGTWISFTEFMEGARQERHHSFNFEKLCLQVRPEDPVTIIYTSGTTGAPKGVVLANTQIINETIEAFAALQIGPEDHTLSFLPYSHVLGRTEHWGHLVIGYTMTYAANIELITEDLQRVQPTVIVGVPRVFEKIYTSLKAKIETSSIDATLFHWAFKIGSQISTKLQNGESINYVLRAENQLAKHLLFDRLKAQLFGKNLRFAVSGGAPLSAEIMRFFHACGILILEGYGLTETTGAICVNRCYDYEFGTVGKPLHSTKIKIASDGEILVKGPTVMEEYYQEAESTAKILQDDWLRTGDIGEISKTGRLVIKDRKKDLIKTANGKYVAPQKLEGMLKELPFISHAHIHGDQKKYIVAVLTLNKNYLFSLARERGIIFRSLEDLKEHPEIKDLVRTGIAQVNLNLASHETIKNYATLAEDFNIESGEITPSLKVRRRVVDQKYKTLIESLY